MKRNACVDRVVESNLINACVATNNIALFIGYIQNTSYCIANPGSQDFLHEAYEEARNTQNESLVIVNEPR